MHISIRQFQLVLAIAEEGSIRGASSRLFVAQPSLTRALQEFETELGVRLFDRHARGMRPTAEGLELARRARDILSRTEEAAIVVSDLAAGNGGEIRLGYTDDFQFGWLPDVLTTFLAEYPSVELQLTQDYSPILAEAVARGQLDLACLFAPTPPHLTDLESLTFDEVSLKLLVSAQDPIATRTSVKLADLQGKEIVVGSLRPESGFYLQIMQALEEVRTQVRFRQGIYPTAMIAEFVAAGIGWSLVTDNSLPSVRDDVVAIPFESDQMRIRPSLIWRKDALNPAAIKLKRRIKRHLCA